jgi:hypothetical protein
MAQGSQSLAVAHHCLEEIAYTKQTTLQFAVKYFTNTKTLKKNKNKNKKGLHKEDEEGLQEEGVQIEDDDEEEERVNEEDDDVDDDEEGVQEEGDDVDDDEEGVQEEMEKKMGCTIAKGLGVVGLRGIFRVC